MTKSIAAHDAERLMRDHGAVLVDVREPDEHARERIPGSRNLPLSRLDTAGAVAPVGRPVVFFCRSGARTTSAAGRLAAAAGAGEAHILAGGLEAWKQAGLPVAVDRRRPIELMRQVQIAAGSLVVVGAALGFAVSPWFHALSAFVGAGLVFAGATGTCGMASLLRLAPWNRADADARAAA